MQVQLRRGLLGQPQPARVVLELPVGVDARLHADLGGAEGHRLVHPAHELLPAVLVGVGRAPALAEAAERAADHAHVGHVDVAVDHEGDGVAGQLGAQLVGRLAHVLDRLRAGLGEQRRQLLGAQRLARPAALDRARHEVEAHRRRVAAARAPARDEAPVARLDHVEHALLEPVGVHVLRVHAEPLGERVAARLELLAHPVRRREGVLGRDVVAVRRQAAEVGGSLFHQRQPPVRQVGRYLNAHVGHQPLRLAHQQAHLVQRDVAAPCGHRGRLAGRPLALGGVGDLGRLGAVVARVRNEVLEDHLLEVAVLGVHLGQGLQRRDTLVGRLAYPDQDPAGEGDPQLARGPDGLQPPGRVLGRRALVHHQVGVDRLEHQPLGGGHLAQSRQVVAAEDAEVGVRQHPPLQRPLAGPGHVRGEVGVAELGQAARHLGIDLRRLAGEHQQLLGAPPRGVVEQALDLIRCVEVRLVGGEGAVLAVAAARPRQREREVAREGDAPHPLARL